MPATTHIVSQAQRQAIERALKDSDQKTCGEIIPVITRASAPYGHSPWLASVLFLALAESLELGLRPFHGDRVPLAALGVAALCVALGFVAARFAWVRRRLTPPKDQALAVHRAAEAAFHHLALHRARGDAGVLIFVSLEERRTVVLAGAGIADLAGAEHWGQTCALVTTAAGEGRLAEGLLAAITRCTEVMAEHHPAIDGGPARALEGRLKILHDSY